MDADPLGLPDGVPPAVLEVARRLRAGARRALDPTPGLADTDADADTDTDDQALLDELLLPLRLEPDWPGPSQPQRVGSGWVQADLTDDDRDTFDRLRNLHPAAGPEELAALAQEWRLPVVPYRPLPSLPPEPVQARPTRERPTQAPTRQTRPAAGLRVLDLTSLWAGPFATALLARRGAVVTKIDPACRPDGFGERPNLYRALNQDKKIIDLDLRRPRDRAHFERLATAADLLITSFSRRVLPNLGYGPKALRRLNPALTTVAIVGFDGGTPEADWLAYGSGIHAVCGLGLAGEAAVARATPVAYPDPLTGHLAVTAAMATVGSGAHTEIPLAWAGRLVAAQAIRDRAGTEVSVP